MTQHDNTVWALTLFKMDVKALAMMMLVEMQDIEDEIDLVVAYSSSTRGEYKDMYKKRESEGAFKILIHKHLVDNDTKFKEYFRLTRHQFFNLLDLIKNDLPVNPTNRVQEPLTADIKLALTLRFLATGESLRSLAFSYRIDHSTISKFLPDVLKALRNRLGEKYLPSSAHIDWNKKAEEFWNRWDFPNCIGAIDGKHIRIISPDTSGSLYHNFKGFFSIVLFALVDANCKFILVDVGSYGKEGDAGIFSKSHVGKLIANAEIFPPPKHLPSSHMLLKHVIVGDEAFRLDTHLLKPYPKKQSVEDVRKRNFNYALCRARRVTENAFGLMSVIFRIFFTPINLKPETVDLVIYVCCCLHNLLRDEYLAHNRHVQLELPEFELPRENMIPLAWIGGFAKSEGFKVRERFTEYFNGAFFDKKRQILFNSKNNK